MSAPLVINTRDGACWTRRTVTEGGIALYALADVCSCPEFVMATLDELAARGIAGSADVLPMPAGPKPKPSDGFRVVVNLWNADDRADAEWAAELAQNALEGQGFKVFATVDEGEPDVAALRAELHTAQAHGRTFLEQRNAHAKELLELRPKVAELKAARADEHDELALALGRSNGDEWADLIEFAAGAVSVEAKLRARVAELEAARKKTAAHVEHLAKTLVARTEDLIAADEQRTALAARLRAGQRWQEGRTPPLVSQDTVSQDELRAIFSIELTAPWETSGKEAAQQPVEGSSYPPALPWARLMDDEDLSDFLDELAAAAGTPGSYEGALATVENAIAQWRLIAEAQHAHNTAPGPDAEAGDRS